MEYKPLRLVDPPFNSPIVDLIVVLNNLRDKQLGGSTPPWIFFQIKQLFQIIESLESARIEGNRTTLANYVTEKLSGESTEEDHFLEIENIEKAMQFIEEYFSREDAPINRAFISEIHKIVVLNLEGEGDKTPGQYRTTLVRITKSEHIPPDPIQVQEYMEELFQFINDLTQPKYDLLKTAIAHHRFVWVHPFTNGNGRTVRLLTYAMLIKQGFKVDRGRILNPTAVFCNNREKYNSMLSKADGAINMGTEEGALEWCHYVLSGLKDEIEKIDKLLRYPYLTKEILLPALAECFHVKKIFNSEQYDWLKLVVEKREVKAADFMQEKSASHSASTSRKLRHLQDLKILKKSPDAERKYIIDFCSNVDLTRSVIHHLTEKGFIPSNI